MIQALLFIASAAGIGTAPGASAVAFVLPSEERVRVLATIPDLAGFVREIGGERVDVDSISRGKEDLHSVTARPSSLVAMSRADMFVEVGLSLEIAFVPGLLHSCRNARVQPGSPGFVSVAQGWTVSKAPAVLSRQAGDVHPQGNPHINLDPRAGLHMATQVYEGLVRVDPGSKALYDARFEGLVLRLKQAQTRWSAMAEDWKGRKVATYHSEYDYLIEAYGLESVGTLESKPGIPPTPKHLSELVANMKSGGCDAILSAQWSNNDTLARVSEAAGVQAVVLPNQCAGMKGADDWVGMMDLIHDRLEQAFAKSAATK